MKQTRRKTSVTIFDKTFASKEKCAEFFSSMLNRYPSGSRVTDEDGIYLIALLRDRHHEAKAKIGCGISHFIVRQDPVWKKCKQFVIVRTDGSVEDFSYVKCVHQPIDRHKRDVLEAMRSDIYSQIQAFKNAAYGNRTYVRCAITNLNVRRQDCHIDHEPPHTFNSLAFDFLMEHGLTLEDVQVQERYGPHETSPLTLSDPLLRQEWQDFHRRFARLRVTLDHANLGQKKVSVDFNKLYKYRGW